jgi:hypothetical protein
MSTSLYMTTANTHILPKVIAQRFETYFKIKVSIVEYVFTYDNYHYTVYFKQPLPTKYLELLETQRCCFLQTSEGLLYIRLKKPTNLHSDYICKYHHNLVTGEMYRQSMECNTFVRKYNGKRYVITKENPFLE